MFKLFSYTSKTRPLFYAFYAIKMSRYFILRFMNKQLYNPRIEGICEKESVAAVGEFMRMEPCEFITTIQ